MAKSFQTPTKSVNSGKWGSFPMRERLSPEPAALVTTKTPKAKIPGRATDRFITDRSAMDFEVANYLLSKENSNAVTSPSKEEYKRQLSENLLNDRKQSRILAFKQKPAPPPEGFKNARTSLYSLNLEPSAHVKPRKAFRHIPQAPERTLDAPDMVDDYYLNLMDWSSGNVLAIALGGTVYLWDATASSIEEVMTVEEDGQVTSVSWAPDGHYLAVGLSDSTVQLWDSTSLRQARTLWNPTRNLASGVCTIAGLSSVSCAVVRI